MKCSLMDVIFFIGIKSNQKGQSNDESTKNTELRKKLIKIED